MLEASDIAGHRGSMILFENLTFRVNAGAAIAVTGPNGAGKTTLLRIVAGLTAAFAGTLRFRGRPEQPFDATLRENVLFAGHASALKDELTAEENVAAHVRLAGAPVSGDAIRTVLEDLGLGGQRALAARVLSAGQRRRVALARLWFVERALWVLDEPLTALDASAAEALSALIRSHLEAGGAAIVATHQPMDLGPGRAQSLALGPAP